MMLPLVLLGVVCSIGPACALSISPDNDHYYAATGSNVTLACHFNHTTDTPKITEIMWSVVLDVDEEQVKKTILWFAADELNHVVYESLKGRINFTSPDPQNGDASITITDVRFSDSMTYQCMVTEMPDKKSKILNLTVMEAQGQPLCNVDAESDGMTLKCGSLSGTPPLKYTWAKISGNQTLPANATVDPIGGTLHVDNITEPDCGRYRCTVESKVATEHCEVVLPCALSQDTDVNKPHLSNGNAITTAVVLVSVFTLGLAAVAIAITITIYWYRKKTSLDITNVIALE